MSSPLSVYTLSWKNKLGRLLWQCVWILLYRPSPAPLHGWRRMLLRCFGARIGAHAHPYPTAKIWGPWNLTMEAGSCLGPHVDCYCVAPVTLGAKSTVSQYSYLCSASHDFNQKAFPLTAAPITVEAHAWIAADVFVGPGVHIGQGAVVGARSTVMRDIEPWSIVAGNPPRTIGHRTPQDPEPEDKR